MDKRLSTPGIIDKLKDYAAVELATGEKTLKDDWLNTEVSPRDPNCTYYYGVQRGNLTGYVVQKDYANYVELAKEYRELEKSGGAKDWLGKLAFVLPESVSIDIVARGYPLTDMQQTGNYSELYEYIEKHVPELKTTNLKLTPNRKARRSA